VPLPAEAPGRDWKISILGLIVEVPLIVNPRPIWWRAVPDPPPAAWTMMFHFFTDGDTVDEWGLAAAIFIARVRRRTGRGPTFSELFGYLLPDTSGLPSPFPDGYSYMERRRLAGEFRLSAAIEWKRRGWISWEPGVTSSLRVGRVFREHSRALRAERTATEYACDPKRVGQARHGDETARAGVDENRG
jgi:hypothetical protein